MGKEDAAYLAITVLGGMPASSVILTLMCKKCRRILPAYGGEGFRDWIGNHWQSAQKRIKTRRGVHTARHRRVDYGSGSYRFLGPAPYLEQSLRRASSPTSRTSAFRDGEPISLWLRISGAKLCQVGVQLAHPEEHGERTGNHKSHRAHDHQDCQRMQSSLPSDA